MCNPGCHHFRGLIVVVFDRPPKGDTPGDSMLVPPLCSTALNYVRRLLKTKKKNAEGDGHDHEHSLTLTMGLDAKRGGRTDPAKYLDFDSGFECEEGGSALDVQLLPPRGSLTLL